MIILQSINWKHLDIDVFTIETDQHRQDILTLLYINLTVIVNNMAECSSSILVRIALIWQRSCIIRVCAAR